MSGPSVQATITVDDQASPALKQLAELAKMIARETANALKPGSGDAGAAQFAKANTVAKQHLDTLSNIRNMYKEIAAIAGGVISGKAAHVVKDKVVEYGKYEKDVRYQGIVGNYNPEERKALDDQRQRFAKDQGVKPEDTLHGQNALVTRNFKSDVVIAATENIMMLAKALNISGEAAAKIVEGKAFGEGHHLSTPKEADEVTRRVADRSVIMNKRGAMTPEDISQNSKFSASTARTANMRPEQADAYAMVLKRNQISGDMSGTSFRGLTTHLIAPTAGGLSSLDSMGIKHSDYSKNGTLSVDNTDQVMRRKFGKGFGPEGKAHLQSQIDDEQSGVAESAEKYAAAVVAAMEKDSGKELSKTDQKHVAKAATEQFNLVRKGFDGAALWDAIVKANPSLQQLIPLVGPKNAGNVALATSNGQQLKTYDDQLTKSDGISTDIATKRNEGLGAALDRLSASVDNAEKNLVKVASVPLESITNFISRIVNMGDSLPDSVKMGAVTAGVLGLGAGALGSVAGVVSLGSAAASAAVSLNLLATKGIPGVTPSIPAGTTAANTAATAPTTAAAATAGSKIAGVIGAAAKAVGVTAVVAAVVPAIYEATSDKAQGVKRDHTRADAARDAIRKDAEERLARATAANDEAAREAAARGDAKVEAVTRRDTPNAMRRAMRDNGPGPEAIDESKGRNTNKPQDISVNGTVSGDATVRLEATITPSAWFEARFNKLEAAVVSLKGQVGGDKLGTGLSGRNGAQPVPATGVQ